MVRAAPGLFRAATPAPTTKTAAATTEHFFKNVGETAAAEAFKTTATGAARTALFKGGMAEPIIGRAFFFVLQDFIRFVDVFEFLFGGFVIRVAVRLIFHGEFAVRLFDLVGVRTFRDSKQLVIILLRHRPFSTLS